MNYNETTFAHRSQLGVSIGAFQEAPGVIVLAAAILNVYSGDVFNKGTARRIICNRIRDLVESRTRAGGRELNRYVVRIDVPETVSATNLMDTLGDFFKPDADEADDTFYLTFSNETLNISGRYRMDADEIWSAIVKNASVAQGVSL